MDRGNRASRVSEEGQSTVEFAIILIFLMAFVLFFIQLSLVFAYGNYVHYATFMGARALLSSGPTTNDQIERSRAVMVRMLKKSEGQAGTDRWPGIAKGVGGGEIAGAEIGPGGQYAKGNPAFSWQQGVRYRFRSRLFWIPLGGDASVNELTLTSESWLGREPSYEECVADLSERVGAIFLDNGC